MYISRNAHGILMSIFVTSKAEKEMLEGLGFEVHLERVVGSDRYECSAVPMPYVISKLLSGKNAEVEKLKKSACDRCHALEAVTDNRYYGDCIGCYNREVGSQKFFYAEGEEPGANVEEELREGVASARYENNFYCVHLPDTIQVIFDSFADKATEELRELLVEGMDFKVREVSGKSLEDITLIGVIPHIPKKVEMVKIDEIINMFCEQNEFMQVSKYHMDYEKKTAVLGIYLKKKHEEPEEVPKKEILPEGESGPEE